ncbi:adhesion G-protein coupled receptor G2 [Misgurnus anguillicaudatus]|uniref:adhesion G-protein coupled receptor G2 n=1 Tax=Misgurnus anguillicaudatus TaxID=75329 RepID=UPI003CCF82D1
MQLHQIQQRNCTKCNCTKCNCTKYNSTKCNCTKCNCNKYNSNCTKNNNSWTKCNCTNCNSTKCNSTKCNCTKCNCTKCNCTKCNCTKYNSTKCNSTKCNSTKCNCTKCNSIKCNSTKCNCPKCNCTKCNCTKYNSNCTKCNCTKYNSNYTKCNCTKCNCTKCNCTKYNSNYCNQKFYWMLINTTDQTLNAENVKEWLHNLDNCIGHDTSNKIARTCEILLELRGPANVCCIRQTVLTASNSFNVNVVGDIEQVGMCFNSNTSVHQKCNQSEIQKNCTSNPPTTETPCSCSSNCKSSEAYYSVTLENVSMNEMDLKPLQNCTVIVKLQTDLTDACSFRLSIEALIKQQNAYIHITDVTRVAMCSWSSNDTMGQIITLIQSSTSFDEFCSNNNNNSMSLVNCLNGALLLKDSCTIQTTVSTNTSVDAEGLLKMTANASSLNSSQVDLIISQLEKLLSGPNVSMGLANTSVGIVNNLLDVPADVMFNFSKRANGLVDTVGLKLVVSGESEKLITSSLALAVKKVNGTNFEMTSFSISDSSNLQVRSDSNRDVVDPTQSTSLGSITLPASLTQNLSPQDQQLASRVQFNFYQKDTFFQDKRLDGLNRKLISGILSTSVSNLSISNLQKNVTITFKNTQNPDIIPKTKKQNVTISVKCVFWDLGLNGGAGGWKSDGCHTVNSSALETQCSCNHLTSFGILLDISKTPIDPLQNTILTYITYIGCGISAIFLSITLLTYLAFEKLRKDIPSKILIHLCLALLLLNLVFLIDPWLAQYQDVNGLCISTAFFLHYFLLASFTWMAMEAVHMYLAIVKVFNTYVSRFMLKIGFAGWGIPLIVVIIVIATNKIGNNYGLVSYAKFIDGTTDYFCWITNDIVFYVAVVVYFCIVFLINFAMFIVVLVQLCRIKRQNPQNVQNRSSWQELRSVAGLTVLLGITWGFAFFAWGPVNLAFMYLFAIFNTFQGLFIFIFHCAMKENVRRQWRAYLCCGKLRLPEHSDWSHTQTQKIKKTTKKRPSSAQSNNSSSSFLNNDSVADAHMGIGNPYDDTIITASEENPSDVVLNEISNKHLRKRSY